MGAFPLFNETALTALQDLPFINIVMCIFSRADQAGQRKSPCGVPAGLPTPRENFRLLQMICNT